MVARPDPSEPLKPTPLPDGPWRDLAVDLMGPLSPGHHLLVVVDYYSRYYEVVVVQTTTAGKVIDCLDDVFSRHGLPVSLKSDNGPQFASEEFQEYCKQNNIMHCKVTARWAQANGEVERQNTGGIARLEEGDEEVLDVLQEHRVSHNREEPGGIAVCPQDERQTTRLDYEPRTRCGSGRP